MIYSASRRTDMVAFYPDEICRRVSRSRKLQALVYWTKDPRNFVTHLGLSSILQTYPTVIQFTLTGLGGTWWEPGVPPPAHLRECLRSLSEQLPQGAIRWRFDPILADDALPRSESSGEAVIPLIPRFQAMVRLLRESGIEPEEATVSFPDAYPKVRARLAAEGRSLPFLTLRQKEQILTQLHEAGGIPLALCCEPQLLRVPGTRPAHCIDGALLDRLYATSFSTLPKDSGQRTQCGCVRSTDIGSYEMRCRHNCRYCYARPDSDDCLSSPVSPDEP